MSRISRTRRKVALSTTGVLISATCGGLVATAGTASAAVAPAARPAPPGVTVAGTAVGATGLSAWAGIYDDHHTSGLHGTKPMPWCNAPTAVPYTSLVNGGTSVPNAIIFEGKSDDDRSCGHGWDTPGILLTNTSSATKTVNIHVAIAKVAPVPGVTAGNKGRNWALWRQVVLRPGQSVVFAQMYVGGSLRANSFDPGDTNYAGAYGAAKKLCAYPSPAKAVVHVVVNGADVAMTDTHQTLNTHGVDSAGCVNGVGTSGRNDESQPWQGM